MGDAKRQHDKGYRELGSQLGRKQSLGDTSDQESHEECREGQLNVRSAHDECVDKPAEIARENAKRDADQHGYGDRRQSDHERDLHPIENGRENVGTLVVGPQEEWALPVR